MTPMLTEALALIGPNFAEQRERCGAERGETVEAVRFLWTMVELSADLVEIVECELRPDGARYTCRNKTTGALITVSRPRAWSEAEEWRYAAELERALAAV